VAPLAAAPEKTDTERRILEWRNSERNMVAYNSHFGRYIRVCLCVFVEEEEKATEEAQKECKNNNKTRTRGRGNAEVEKLL
jgi:hypothetical protein